ncbi:ImmA/IrrE family metallo-endopeptidase [Rhizobium mongolense]|uniref:ImmA/IrrE family metallo-endopeptidase n=1 Tax=Rhizobium mongolense TaxID=57676 RepID=UPI0035561AAB
MAARVTALINPALLRWARETAGYSQEEAAEKLGQEPETYREWETGESPFSMAQLRKAADLFKRPMAVFYLAEPPQGFQVMRDFRRLPGMGFRKFPVGLNLEIRSAVELRDLAIELSGDLNEAIPAFNLWANIDENTDVIGERIRSYLGVSSTLQKSWKDADGRTAFNAWRTRIEAIGTLVFQATRFASDEASGIAIWGEPFPTIVINRKDAPTRRTFSLLHELAHLALRVSGVSDLETDALRPPEDQRIEVFCNAVAAAALMPRDALYSMAGVVGKPIVPREWSDAEIADMARSFGVSREAIVRRLLTLDLATADFYGRKRAQYSAEHAANVARARERAQASDMRRNMPQETISNLGRPLVKMVLNNYYQDRITLSDVSGYLTLKTKHLPRLEQMAGTR